MAILVSEVLADLTDELSDPSYVTWTEAQLISYINDAQKQLSLVRPDSTSVIEAVQLVPGTKQTIPSTNRRLLDIVRNMGADGVTPGPPVRATDRDTLDLFNQDWHNDAVATAIKNFIYDEDYPDTYYVTPPVHGSTAVYVEGVFSKNPTVLTLTTESLEVDDVYKAPILHWALFRAYSKEMESRTSIMNKQFHYKAFYDALGIKVRVDAGSSPSKEKEITQRGAG